MQEREKSEGEALARRSGGLVPEVGAFGPWMSPFSMVRRIIDDMDRMFEGLSPFRSPLGGFGLGFGESFWPPLEVYSEDGQIVVRADLPGMRDEDVRVEIEGDRLTLAGERRKEREERKGGILHSERSYGSFRRSIVLPEGVDTDSAEASFQNGVLEVRMKAPGRRGRRLEIKSKGEARTTHGPEVKAEQAAARGAPLHQQQQAPPSR
ncbi:MAG: Hsp20/alpha crystallin family protein [Pseudomonadota bacterium]